MKLRITNMNMYCIYNAAYMYMYTRTCTICRDSHCWYVLCGRTCTMHVEYTRSDQLPSLCASAVDMRIQTHHSV